MARNSLPVQEHDGVRLRVSPHLPAAKAGELAELLRRRAAARTAGFVQLERELREQILAALPIWAPPAEDDPASATATTDAPSPPIIVPRAAEESKPASDAPLPPVPAAPPERPARHSVVWEGELFWDNHSAPVRLRNVSANGALVLGAASVPAGKEVVLTLKAAGAVFASVRWSRSGRIGLEFEKSFDVRKLIQAERAGSGPSGRHGRPGVLRPAYLDSENDPHSPWAARWEKLSRNELG